MSIIISIDIPNFNGAVTWTYISIYQWSSLPSYWNSIVNGLLPVANKVDVASKVIATTGPTCADLVNEAIIRRHDQD